VLAAKEEGAPVVPGMKEERRPTRSEKQSRLALRPGIGAIYCYRVWDEVLPQ
jgi:hypothetical protein